MAIRVGGQYMLQLCSVSNSLSHTTLSSQANELRGIFFKEVFAWYYILRRYDSAWICIWLYNKMTASIINTLALKTLILQLNMRCPRCNGYRRRKWRRRHEFKSSSRLIAFHIALIPLGKIWIQLFSLQLWVNSRADCVLQLWWGN